MFKLCLAAGRGLIMTLCYSTLPYCTVLYVSKVPYLPSPYTYISGEAPSTAKVSKDWPLFPPFPCFLMIFGPIRPQEYLKILTLSTKKST